MGALSFHFKDSSWVYSPGAIVISATHPSQTNQLIDWHDQKEPTGSLLLLASVFIIYTCCCGSRVGVSRCA